MGRRAGHRHAPGVPHALDAAEPFKMLLVVVKPPRPDGPTPGGHHERHRARRRHPATRQGNLGHRAPHAHGHAYSGDHGAHRRRGAQVEHSGGQDHLRPAHRPGRPARRGRGRRVGRPGPRHRPGHGAVRALRAGLPGHGGLPPGRAGFPGPGRGAGGQVRGRGFPGQGQDGRVGLPAVLRRVQAARRGRYGHEIGLQRAFRRQCGQPPARGRSGRRRPFARRRPGPGGPPAGALPDGRAQARAHGAFRGARGHRVLLEAVGGAAS